MKKKLPIILTVTILFAGAISIARVSAQETVRTFTISPPVIELEVAPGESKEGTLKIINDGSTSLNFDTSIRDFIVEDNIGTPKILPPNTLSNKYSGASWIGIYPTQVYVSPKQSTTYSYYVQVPADARPGGRYAAVLYTPTNPTGVTDTGAAVNTSVGSLFYITVKGPVTEKATVTEFNTKKLWETGPVTLNTLIKNESDIHISPVGTITLKNMLGRVSETKPVKDINIFPGASREFETTLGKDFMFGRYEAELQARYGSENKTLSAVYSFWVIPWKLLILIFGIILAIIIGGWYWKKGKKLHSNPEPTQPQNPQP